MKKGFATTIILLFLICPLLDFASANPEVYASMPKLQIDSPTQNTSYSTSTVSFAVTGQVRHDQLINQAYPYFTCNFDGFNFIVNATYVSDTSDGWALFKCKINLIELSNGQHSVSVNCISASQIASMTSPSVSFIVADSTGVSVTLPSTPEFNVNFGGFRQEPIGMNSYTYPVPWAKFTFKNQQNPSLIDGQKVSLYYYYRWKPHENSSWYSSINPTMAQTLAPYYMLMLLRGEPPNSPHVNGLVDFQVAARVVSITEQSVYVSQKSDWSNTQTTTIPASSISPGPTVPSSSPTPPVPELSWLVILPLLLSMFSVAVLLRHRNQVKKL